MTNQTIMVCGFFVLNTQQLWIQSITIITQTECLGQCCFWTE